MKKRKGERATEGAVKRKDGEGAKMRPRQPIAQGRTVTVGYARDDLKIQDDEDGTLVLVEKQPDEPDDAVSAIGPDLDIRYSDYGNLVILVPIQLQDGRCKKGRGREERERATEGAVKRKDGEGGENETGAGNSRNLPGPRG